VLLLEPMMRLLGLFTFWSEWLIPLLLMSIMIVTTTTAFTATSQREPTFASSRALQSRRQTSLDAERTRRIGIFGGGEFAVLS